MTFDIRARRDLVQQPKQDSTEVVQAPYLIRFQCQSFVKMSYQKFENNFEPEVGVNMAAMEDISEDVFCEVVSMVLGDKVWRVWKLLSW